MRSLTRCSALVVLALLPALPAQNSTRKLRTVPSATAERVGEAIPFVESFEEATKRAVELGRPVFWYVPTLAGSPMDRQTEIDRYVRGGPFSWPSTIDLLRSHFVCLRLAPSGELQKRFDLRRGRFVEPGYLVLGTDGEERLRVHSLTTFHPQWFEAPLRRLLSLPDAGFPCTGELRELWDAFRADDFATFAQRAERLADGKRAPEVDAEFLFLRGAAQKRQNQEREAVATFEECMRRFPETTWGQKCALEAEGHGPFLHGFEVFGDLPERVLRELDEGSRAPRGSYTEAELWQRGVAFLLRAADADGLVRDSIYDFGGTDGLPNVHVAVSFLCGEALLHAARRADAGQLELDSAMRAAVEARLLQLRDAAEHDRGAVLEDRDEIVWARAYRVRFLARWAAVRGEAKGTEGSTRALLGPAVAALSALQPDTGMWFHEYGNAFAVATALQALAAAREAGVAIDERIVARGLGALERCRTEAGTYSYADPGKREPRATAIAAAGRMPLCELARFLFGKAEIVDLEKALATAFEHHGPLAAVRKYDDHADQHGYGGFFFWFDMLGRAEAVMRLPPGAQRDLWRAQQKKLVLDLPEFDGCFVDSHELGRCYGTAMALLCLASLGG